jgi:hypothetical protein
MPLPSSGQISIKQIFDEATGGGCYEGGSGYSLGALADALGIGTNPDAMSEFYGLSCPFIQIEVFFLEYFDGTVPQGYNSNTDACLFSNLYEFKTVYFQGALGNGTQLWEDSGGTVGFYTNGGWFYFSDDYVFQLDGNAIFDFTSCA